MKRKSGKASRARWAQLLESDAYRETPWKNGGGRTAEIAIHPPGASLDAFDWRLSSAEVAQPGPFSIFSGYRRLLTLLAGKELVLRSEAQVAALEVGDVFGFDGGEAFAAEIPGGPVRDLGLIFRTPHQAALKQIKFAGKPRSFRLQAPTNFFYAAAGAFSVSLYPGELMYSLAEGDCLRVGDAPGGAERLILCEPRSSGGWLAGVEISGTGGRA